MLFAEKGSVVARLHQLDKAQGNRAVADEIQRIDQGAGHKSATDRRRQVSRRLKESVNALIEKPL